MSKVLDVLVVGAGPVGTFLATELLRQQVNNVRIVEKQMAISPYSKAAALHARSLEILPNADRFIATGLAARAVSIYSNGKRMAHVSLNHMQSEYNYALMVPQNETEEILSEHLRSTYGVVVERGVELLAVEEVEMKVDPEVEVEGRAITEKVVKVTLQHLNDDSVEEVYTRWLVGCDGARSTVRKAMNIEFAGTTVETVWLTADVHVKEPDFPVCNELTVMLSPQGFLGIFPLKEKERRFRVALDLPREYVDKIDTSHELTLEEFQRWSDGRLSAGQSMTYFDPVWVSSFKINERRVNTMRRGRVLLAGDAAHIHSPAGGQGMNTGLQDAHNLAWKLALVIKGKGHEGILLDSFCSEREANAEKVLKGTASLRTMVTLDSAVTKTIRDVVAPFVTSFDAVQRKISNTIGEMDITYDKSPLTCHNGRTSGSFSSLFFTGLIPAQFLGARIPTFHLSRATTKQAELSHDIIKGSVKHQLFVLNRNSHNQSKPLDASRIGMPKDLVQVNVIVDQYDDPSLIATLEQEANCCYWTDDSHEFKKAFGLASDCEDWVVVLVRPDGYIGFAGDLTTADIHELHKHLRSYLCY